MLKYKSQKAGAILLSGKGAKIFSIFHIPKKITFWLKLEKLEKYGHVFSIHL
jgi:hypothetical protein